MSDIVYHDSTVEEVCVLRSFTTAYSNVGTTALLLYAALGLGGTTLLCNV